MSFYTDKQVRAAVKPILDNFHPPTNSKPTWHIRPEEMARAVLDVVAPAIAAQVLRDAADYIEGAGESCDQAAERLRWRAEEVLS